MERPEPHTVSVSRRIEAPAHVIFEVLVDPTTHPVFDGSGMLRDGGSIAVVRGVGDAFTTKMYLPDLGDYEMQNNVVEYQLDKRIAWEPTPGDVAAAINSGLEIGSSQGYRWGFELAPDGAEATIVTEIFDCAEASEAIREAVNDGEAWIESMTKSLERLDQLCAQRDH